MSEPVLRISDVAKRLGLSAGTIRAFADKGLIPAVKLPSGHRRFRPEDVEDLRRNRGFEDLEPKRDRDE